GSSSSAFIDQAEQGADRDGLAVLGGDLAERSGGRRRDLDRDLVGLELDQGLVDGNRIACLLEPAADGGLGHGFAERRNANFSHNLFPNTMCCHRPPPGLALANPMINSSGRSSSP